MAGGPIAGWYPDPEDQGKQRYWDGARWTEHRAPGSVASFVGALPETPTVEGPKPPVSSGAPPTSVPRAAPAPTDPTWFRRHPWATLAIACVVALLVGVAIGSAGSQPELDTARADLKQARHDLDGARSENESLKGQVAEARGRVKKLSARGQVPSFTGQTIDEAQTAQQVGLFDWKIKTRSEVRADADPGTVTAQAPKEGTMLAAGRSITLTVARKPPPKPKQWVTTTTLSGSGGASKSDQFTVPSGSVRMVYDMSGSGNNAITLYRAPAEYVDLLVNTIGPASGKTRIYQPGTYYLDVTGDSWSVEIQVFKRPQ